MRYLAVVLCLGLGACGGGPPDSLTGLTRQGAPIGGYRSDPQAQARIYQLEQENSDLARRLCVLEAFLFDRLDWGFPQNGGVTLRQSNRQQRACW